MARFYRFLFIFLCILSYSVAELPPDIPGDEITEDYMRWALPKDTALPQVDNTQPISATWYDKAAKTWDAPPLAEQMTSDRANIPLGKGGIFIPKFSEFFRTPDIEILDPKGEIIITGEFGKTYSVEPGTYFVVLGSGSHRQRIVRQVVVEESKATPVLPDWCGLSIETVDSNSIPFRGEYEIVRIDEFEPYGRGFGADPGVGEALTTWILKPGIYKIFGRGQSFNTLRNFVTIRLLPGEYVKFLLVQKIDDYSILGGGTVDLAQGTKVKSHWRYGANIGGSLNFVGEIDKIHNKNNKLNLNLDLRSKIWFTYNKSPFEWISDLLISEGFNVSDLDFFTKFDIEEAINASDEIRMSSLFIWRVLTWAGPYGRTEISTNFFPSRVKRDEKTHKEFYISEGYNVSSADKWDSSRTFKLSNSFNPFNFEIGAGANFDAIRMRVFDAKVRLGVGYSISALQPRYEKNVTSDNINHGNDSLFLQRLDNSKILQKRDRTSTAEFGPQASLVANLHIGRFATAIGEFKIFTPVAPETRFTRPDFDLITTLSWRLSRAVTFDYDYKYAIKQPEKIDARINKSTHCVWLRFSYSSR